MKSNGLPNTVIAVIAGLLFGLLSVPRALALDNPDDWSVIDVMRLVNDHWIYPAGPGEPQRTPGTAVWNDSVYHIGNMAMYALTGDSRYRDYSQLWSENNGWIGTSDAVADRHAAGSVFIDLYPEVRDRSSVEWIIGELNRLVDDVDMTNRSDRWWWIDAIFMAAPVYAKLGVLCQENPALALALAEDEDVCKAAEDYWDKMDRLFRYARDTEAGGLYTYMPSLWWRDGENTRRYWLRGNGWVIAGMARVLDALPAGDARRLEYETMLKEMAAELKSLQGGDPRPEYSGEEFDGFWIAGWNPDFSAVLCSQEGGDPIVAGVELSGTALITYALAWGINNGVLDPATYLEVVQKAWHDMVQEAVDNDGRVGYIQSNAYSPCGSAAPPFDASDTADSNVNSIFGIGAFLLAGSEVAKLAPKRLPLSVEDVSYEEPDNWATNSVDDNLDTRWSCIGECVVVYDLGAAVDVQRVDVAFYRGDIRDAYFGLEASVNGDSWTPLVADNTQSPARTLEPQTVWTGEQTARYLRYTGQGNSVNAWVSITEFQVYGKPASTPRGRLPLSVEAVSYEQPDNWATNSIDDNLDTRWSCIGECVVVYDLGAAVDVQRVDVAFYRGDIRDAYFGLEASVNGDSWTPLVADNTQSPARTLEPQTVWTGEQPARYLRYTGQGNSVNAWVSITEFQVYGNGRLPLSVEAVSYEQPDNWATNSIDDNLDTRWSCIGECVVVYDLDAAVDVQRVDVAFYQGDIRDAYFGLEASVNGDSWTPLVADNTQSPARTLQPQTVWTGEQTARYLRYTGQGNSVNAWVSVTEFQVYGVGP